MRLLIPLILALSLHAQSLQYTPPEDPAKVLQLPREAKEYFSKFVDEKGSMESKVDTLLQVILDKDKFGFVYEGDGLYHVAETFKRHRGNCQSFAMLLTSLCRAFDIEADFHHVRLYAPKWGRIGEVVVEVEHVNVRVCEGQKSYVLDIAPFNEAPGFVLNIQTITDDEMLSMFYSDVGVLRFAAGQKQESLHWMEKAVEISPLPSCIRNLATAYLGLSQFAEAELYARRVYSIDRRDPKSAFLLAKIMTKLGRNEEAASFEKLGKKYELKNPYYHYSVARSAQNSKDLAKAMSAIKQAIRLKSDEIQFWQLKKELLVQNNEPTTSVDRSISRLIQR
jgi:tetratricopeptide (TPR) repeat protein